MRRNGRFYDRFRRAIVFFFTDAAPENRRQAVTVSRGEDPPGDGDSAIESIERDADVDPRDDHNYAADPRQAVVFTESVAYFGGVPGVKRNFRGQPMGLLGTLRHICTDMDDDDDSDAVLDQAQ